MNDCFVEYDLLTSGNENWWFPALGLIAGGIACLVYFISRFVAQKPLTPAKRFSLVIPIFLAAAWTIVSFAWTYGNYHKLVQVYRQGDYREISGKIENLMDSNLARRGGDESFEVSGVRFSFSRYVVSPGFRETRAAGGAIREGRVVRIRYIGDAIVRLEICGEKASRNG